MPLLRVEIKRIIRAIPKLLGMAALLLAIVAALSFGASTLFDSAEDTKIKIALSLPPVDDNIGGVVMGALEGMDSVQNALMLVNTDTEDEAIRMVRNGAAAAAVIVPDGFLNSVMYGENMPAKVLLRDGASMECSLIVHGGNAAADMLRVSQSGVFAIFDAAKEVYGDTAELDTILYDSNLLYINLILSRQAMIAVKNTMATGTLSESEFIISSGVVLLLMLLSTAVTGMFARENGDYYKRMATLSVSGFSVAISKLAAVFILLLSFTAIIGVLLKLTGMIYSWASLIKLLPVILLSASMQVFTTAAAKNKMAGVMLQFTLFASLLFAAGGILPEAFLPKLLIEISEYLPVLPMLEQTRGVIAAFPSQAIAPCLIWSGAMLGASAVLYSRGLKV